MSYEFTRKKIAADRKRFWVRLAVAGVAGAAGFGLGVALNDLSTFYGVMRCTVLAVAAGFSCYYVAGWFSSQA